MTSLLKVNVLRGKWKNKLPESLAGNFIDFFFVFDLNPDHLIFKWRGSIFSFNSLIIYIVFNQCGVEWFFGLWRVHPFYSDLIFSTLIWRRLGLAKNLFRCLRAFLPLLRPSRTNTTSIIYSYNFLVFFNTTISVQVIYFPLYFL